jgi:hypothetical protein
MNTQDAATKANVTASTVRTWCRIGAVTAAKSNGRWNIDEASLAHRIALTAKRAAPTPLTAEQIIALGGSRWTRNGMDRIYINDWAQYAGIETAHYNTGNICGAWIGGRGIANGRIGRILGTVSKVYFDTADGRLYIQHNGARDIEVRYLDGQRETLDLFQMIIDGVKSAAAAL